jgi:hypothetical protein
MGEYIPDSRLADKGINQAIDRPRSFFCEGVKCLDDEGIFKGHTFAKAQIEGRLNVCFFLRISKVSGNEVGPEYEDGLILRARIADPSVVLPFGDQPHLCDFANDCINAAHANLWDVARNHKQSVFVAGVKGIQAPQFFVPVLVRLETAYRFRDIFTGEPYLSLLNGAIKGVLFASEGKLDFPLLRRSILDHAKDRKVERRPEIMDGISDYQGETWWNGLLGFGPEYYLSSLAFELNDQNKGFLCEKGVDPLSEVVDVMAGPL